MGQVSVSGALTAGPPQGSAGSLYNTTLQLVQPQKGFVVSTGILAAALASPSAFVTLAGIGASSIVTKGDTLYLRSADEVTLRITTDDGVGGNVVATITIQGTVLLEFSATKFLKLLEAKGTVSSFEYFASGPA